MRTSQGRTGVRAVATAWLLAATGAEASSLAEAAQRERVRRAEAPKAVRTYTEVELRDVRLDDSLGPEPPATRSQGLPPRPGTVSLSPATFTLVAGRDSGLARRASTRAAALQAEAERYWGRVDLAVLRGECEVGLGDPLWASDDVDRRGLGGPRRGRTVIVGGESFAAPTGGS